MAHYVELYAPLVFVLVVSLTLHELAHAWVATRLGDPTPSQEGRVSLNPLDQLDLWGSLCFILTQGFGWAKPVQINPTNFRHPRRDTIFVIAAGPLVNLLLGLLSGLLFYGLLAKGVISQVHPQPLIRLLFDVLKTMMTVNFLLFFFNLLPLHPLDGSQLLTNALPLNQAYAFKRFNVVYGPVVLVALVLFGVLTKYSLLQMLFDPPTTFLIGIIKKLVIGVA